MAGNDYRQGRRPVQVLLPLGLHGNVKRLAADGGVSQQEWLVDAVREKVERDAVGGVGPRAGLSVVSGVGGSRDSSGRGGADLVGVGADTGGDPLVDPAVLMGEREDLYLTRPLAVFEEFATDPGHRWRAAFPKAAADEPDPARDPINDIA